MVMPLWRLLLGQMTPLRGKPRHIIGYMQDFLFSPERARTPAKVLSGGERNRLLLARLFTKPSNVLVMDEPLKKKRSGQRSRSPGNFRIKKSRNWPRFRPGSKSWKRGRTNSTR